MRVAEYMQIKKRYGDKMVVKAKACTSSLDPWRFETVRIQTARVWHSTDERLSVRRCTHDGTISLSLMLQSRRREDKGKAHAAVDRTGDPRKERVHAAAASDRGSGSAYNASA